MSTDIRLVDRIPTFRASCTPLNPSIQLAYVVWSESLWNADISPHVLMSLVRGAVNTSLVFLRVAVPVAKFAVSDSAPPNMLENRPDRDAVPSLLSF